MHIGFWTENCTEVRWSINIGSMISAFLFFYKKTHAGNAFANFIKNLVRQANI